ncbi:MAG: SUMF1/EgtB/PvdO family nonheme iron enzyme [Ramlibacter sp.]|uniref:SUMF1/EgtB/PvdO family nonheme iron enzyme n=1 Tax=Ramlibacter sp. TaxID=1917967 RepID=UPI00260806AB|nr:SUMF1/EgtB/PvdO family nonheme iron enzyme [Ramlibacter sp.]MDH4375535.1 SUMF1/EgtB/PvdO family nonheme iron enzyme [Ramlibacter sp.]
MPTNPSSIDVLTDSPAIRQAGRSLLSLALMDARNCTLQLLARFEEAVGAGLSIPRVDHFDPPERVAGHIAWLAEWWLGRNPQRGLGFRSPADGPRLPSLHRQADSWFRHVGAEHWPELGEVRGYMLVQLESTLEILERAEETDDGLYLFRAMLHYEDFIAEQLVAQARALGLSLPVGSAAEYAAAEPLNLPATRWLLGAPANGFALAIERPQWQVNILPFEIDAQPVNWSQFVEFVDDGGYDRSDWWHPQGWEWLRQASIPDGRRGPRHVEQIRAAAGGVVINWSGRSVRVSGSQPVTHITWWEADAWARWAGRRLPLEMEWEVAVHQRQGRSMRWGDVLEWTSTRLRPWDGYERDNWAVGTALDPQPHWEMARVLRGGSISTRGRMKHKRSRRFALPDRDEAFTGFRTCAL